MAKKKQTVLVIAGVAVGSMVMILTFGLAEGIIAEIENKIIDISPLITIKGEKLLQKERVLVVPADNCQVVSRVVPDEKKEVKPYTEVVALVRNLRGIDAISPFVMTRGVIRCATLSRPCAVKGIVPKEEANIGKLGQDIISGSLDELSYTNNGVLLGTGLASKINARYHDIVRLTGQNGKVYNLLVVGIFESGFGAVDDNNAYINLSLAQTIEGLAQTAVSGIGLHTTTLLQVNQLSKQVSQITGYRTETWEEANANLLSLFERNNNITFFLVVFVFVVAGFGIANVLITIVLQKQRDIAILKSIGVGVKTTEVLFLVEGILIGVTGALIGAIAGHYITSLVSALPISYGPSAVVRGNHIVTVEKPVYYIATTLFAIMVSAVSGYGPAHRAARLKPVDILRA
jgi:lipoprotein-releasing system permease protein